MNSATRKLILPTAAAIVTIIAALLSLRVDRQSCPTAKEFTDSLASNRSRLAGVDSALARFDLTESARPIGSDSTAGAPNRLERRIVALRMQGVTRTQIDRWLREDVHLTPLAAGAVPAARDSQLALIHRLETDSVYINDLRKQLLVTNDLWHDMTVVPRLTARWVARCTASRAETPILVTLWLLTLAGLFAWEQRRRRSA